MQTRFKDLETLLATLFTIGLQPKPIDGSRVGSPPNPENK